MDESKKISIANDARTATVLLNALTPDLDDIRRSVIGKMKQDFRAGKATLDGMLASVAQLCTLDDLENKYRAKIRAAEKKG